MSKRAERPPTIKQVARQAGVALSTVSRVLNDHPDVSAAMRVRVLQAVDELGYESDLLASSLRRGQTQTVGFIVADIVNPLFARILRGAERSLRAAGYSVLLAHSEGDPSRDVEGARLLRRRRVDGLILSLADDTREETQAELASLDIPVVLLDRDLHGVEGLGAVLADHRTGVRRAVEHLLGLGHRRIAMITGSLGTRPAREREAGFREAFQRFGLNAPEELLHHGHFAAEFGTRVADRILGATDPPTAIITGGNLILEGVIAALHRRGVEVGQDLSLVTCDDTPLAQFHTPPVTVVSRDITAMGDLAAAILLDQLRENRPARCETVATELLVRDSTRPPP